MKYKKTMILLVLVVFLLGIAYASASEIDDTIASEDTDSMELSANNADDNLQNDENAKLNLKNNDETLSANDAEVLSADSATYSDLAEEIGQSGNIKLSHKNYTYDDGANAISIREANKVIDGDGAVIDMKGATIRALDVGASGVTIKNLTIKNVNFRGLGGAIYFSSPASVINCNFINNSATYGCSLYFNTNGTVTNCSFSNNNASESGTVYFDTNGIVTNCSFFNNSASLGGAIAFNSRGTVTNCNFTDNTVSQNGGAVYFYFGGEVTNCNFINNTATGTSSLGGAIRMNSGAVKNSNFVNNSAQRYGGAIDFVGTGTVSNCSFSNNSASSQAGAIMIGAEGTVTDCNFTDNSATYNSGAIRFEAEGTVTNCNFVNNSAADGGAIMISSGTLTDCNFTDNNASQRGGAVFFEDTGEVTNCNFYNNSASSQGGAIWFTADSTVTYCNFVGNTATGDGGAVWIPSGTFTICNFTDNTAGDYGGAVYVNSNGDVTNCNFASNNASEGGGAVRMSTGTVTTCNFADNSAANGGAILGMDVDSVGVDTCIFKTDSDTTYNTRNLPPTLDVDNFTTIYGSDDKLTFVLNTYGGTYVDDGNISITVYFKGDNSWVGNYSCLSGEGWIPNLKVGSYYAIFDTEYAEFQPVNRTITILMPEGNYYVNVTSQTTNNKTVNITAKTNIPQNIIWDDKLLFILPNMDSIVANYDGNGTWWAVHTFDDYADYQVNATYVGLDDVTITNATISISKTPTEITVENETVQLLVGNSVGTGATLTPADAGNLTFTSGNITVVKVEDGKIIAVGEGSAVITVSFTGNEDYLAAENKTISVTVSLRDASVSVNNRTLDLFVGDTFTIVPTTTPEGLNVTFVSDESGVYSIENGVITALKEGTGSVTVKVGGDGTYIENSTVVSVTVSKVSTEITVENDNIVLEVNGEVVTGVTLNPADAGNVTYTVSNSSVVKVENGKIMALNAGSAVITVSFAGDEKYVAAENKTISVTVSLRDASVSVNNRTLDLFVGDTFTISANTVPDGLEVTFVSDNSGIYSIDENGLVTALKEGTGSVTVKVGGDGIYAENSTVVSLSVSKVPTEITVENATVELFAGNSVDAGATLTPADAGNLTYTLSNSSVVKVEDGKIMALNAGSAVITVSFAGDDKYAEAVNKTISVTVNLNDASVSVNNQTLDLFVGDTFTISATTIPDGLTVTFIPDESGVYSIENGVITALKEGSGSVTVKVGGDGIYAENTTAVSVTVSKVPTEITVENATVELFAGNSVDAGATLTPADAGNLTYTVSNSSVVKVEDGKIMALNAGSAVITVSFVGDDKYAEAVNKTISVTVKLNDASISVNNSTLDLFVGDTFTIVPTTIPAGLDVTFVADDSGVYSVDDNGLVTALKEGSGSVTVKVGGDGIYTENTTVVSVTVAKVPTEISVLNDNLVLVALEDVATGITLTPADAGNVTYTVSNSSVVKVEDGKIIALREGSAVITVSFAGDDKYAEAVNKTINVTVKLNDASVSVNNSTLDLFVGETFTIVATTVPSGLNVTFIPDDSGVYSIDDNGVVTALKNGTGSIFVKVGGDGVYDVNITFVSVTVSRVPTEITVENATVELFAGNSVDAGATLTPAGAGNLTFTSSNITVAKVEDGKIIAVGEGSAVITVSFAGDDDHYAEAENKTLSVTVKPKYESKVTISPIAGVVYPNSVTITYSVENRTEVTVSIGGVSDDKIIIANDTITVIGLDAGEYTITVINSENISHSKSSDTKTFTVSKQATSIAAASVSTVYNKNKVLVITLKDGNGKALANAKVTVVLGKSKTYTTDKNGQVKVSTKGLKPKTYTAKVTFNGNTNYAKSTKNVKVTVKKATPKMTAKKKTFKRSVKVKKYAIVLKNNVGKAIKKTKVTIKIGKKTFTAKTNSKGKAIFKIKKLTKKGTYKSKVTYRGNAYYKKVTKTVKIKIK